MAQGRMTGTHRRAERLPKWTLDPTPRTLLSCSTEGSRAITDSEPPSVARGFLFADLRNYSAWVETHGDHAAANLLRAYRDLVRQAAAEFHGAEIKTEGDSFYVVFGSPSVALSCGLRILELARQSQAAAGGPIPVGVGVHVGETVATDEGYVGSVVNVAARVCAKAAAGELLVTDAVRSLTRTYLDVTFLPRGRKRLKGISEPIGLYRVTPASASEPPSPLQRLAARWPIAAAALAIVLAVLVVAYLGGALIRETAGTPASSSFIAASPTAGVPSGSAVASADVAFPSAAETALLGLLPEHDRDRCQRADPEDRPIAALFRVPGETPERYLTSVEAGIECELGGISAPDRLWLWQVVRTGLDNARAALAAHAGIAGAAPGICREERPAVENWSFGGTSGRLVCYESATGDAVLLWVFDGSQLFARALRDDQDMDALLDWWEDVGRFAAP
jgi:class 3 adenylate cyclase